MSGQPQGVGLAEQGIPTPQLGEEKDTTWQEPCAATWFGTTFPTDGSPVRNMTLLRGLSDQRSRSISIINGVADHPVSDWVLWEPQARDSVGTWALLKEGPSQAVGTTAPSDGQLGSRREAAILLTGFIKEPCSFSSRVLGSRRKPGCPSGQPGHLVQTGGAPDRTSLPGDVEQV